MAGLMVLSISIGKERNIFNAPGPSSFAGYAIETPRLLLNSACPGYRHGLANSSGTLGKYLMAQAGNVVAGDSKNSFDFTKHLRLTL